MKEKIIFGILKSLARLPLGILYFFADFITLVLYSFLKYRRKVVWGNLTSSFPEKTKKEIKKIEKGFYSYLGDQIVETLKLLHVSDKELAERISVENIEIVNQSLAGGKSAVVLMGHYGNWEWVQEICRYLLPESFMVSIYHPLNNKMWDNFFIKLRSRWGAHIVPMNKAPRTLLSSQNIPWVCGFIADAYTWHKKDDNWIDFLNHKTWFIYGPEEIGKKVDANFFFLSVCREKRGYYTLRLSPLIPEEKHLPYPYMREFWKHFEDEIKKKPALWLWSHKRWK